MDKIKKIIQFVEVDENNLSNNEGKVYVFFEDESIDPVEISDSEAYKAYDSIAKEHGVAEEDIANLKVIVAESAANGTLALCNSLDPVELENANKEFEDAKKKAEELRKQKEEAGELIVPPVVPPLVPTEADYTSDLEEEVSAKKHTGAKVVAGILAGAAAFGAGYGLAELLNRNPAQNNQDLDDDQDLNIDYNFDTATFDQLMDSMSDDDARKVVAEQAMELVNTFHEATHKDGNFRLVEDGETYLDLSFEEALVLTTFANYSEPDQLYEILGSYEMTAEQAQDLLESARTKLITYYMNAIEPSGLANIFANEQDKQFFNSLETSVCKFNAEHTKQASDQVIRDVYYNYILDGSTNAANLSPMARLLAFDAVYGGLNLTESASVDHTQFLEFHGEGINDETKYYITNVLHLDYDSLTEDQIAQYRENIIEAGTDLVSVLANGQVMTEENSTKEELEENVSLTDLVDKMGICNSVNNEISQKMQALDSMAADKAAVENLHIANVNSAIAIGLRDAGLDDLAARVESAMTEQLSADLVKAIRSSGATGADLMENYENKVLSVSDANRPSMEHIVSAANKDLAKKANYAGSVKDVSTLINNRRHGVENHLTEGSELTEEEKNKGIVGKDENGVPVFDQDVIDKLFEGMTEEEKDDFIIQNGAVVEEETIVHNTTQEEVKYEDLTEEEKVVVDQEKIDIFTKDTLANVNAEGKIAANQYENDSNYIFTPGTIVNPVTGTEYNLNDMNFASAVARMQAFANTKLNEETGLIERTGDYNLDVSKDSQIQNAAEVAAENYLNGISQQEKDAIAAGMNTTWENAKEQLKTSYKDGYMERMQEAVKLAIQEGNEQFETTRQAQEDAIAKSKESEENAYLNSPVAADTHAEEAVVETPVAPEANAQETGVETPVAPEANAQETGVETPVAPEANAQETGIETPVAPEANVQETGVETPVAPEANVQETGVEDQDEVDWSAISTAEDEVVIVSADGTNLSSDNEQKNQQEFITIDFSAQEENNDLEAAIQQAYEEALARDAAAVEDENSMTGKVR